MIKRIAVLFSLVLFLGVAGAQDSEYKVGLSVKKLFLDYLTFYSGDSGAFQRYDNGVEIAYSRSLLEQLNLYVPVKLGVISREGSRTEDFMIGLDLQGQYYPLTRGRIFNPYGLIGLGISSEKGNRVEDVDFLPEVKGSSNVQIPLGIGVDVMFHRRGYLNVQTEYRVSTGDDRNNINIAIGFKYLLGYDAVDSIKTDLMDQKDSDGDGTIDDLDLCPDTPGPKEFQGCPDTDGDGIMDPRDKCPEEAGPKELKGCPDTDGDGVSDNEDECPTISGLISNKGCPEDNEDVDTNGDKDGDGVLDRYDRCPNIPGVKEAQGCPKADVDTDGDGIIDSEDNCPNTPGPAANAGCPSEEQKDTDNDGVPDSRDLCPSLAGTISGQGCPDTDGDGVNDILDECPNVKGLIRLDGCPDKDGDGIADKFDDCPNQYGIRSRNGCPEPTKVEPVLEKKDQDVLEFAMRAVQFNTGSTELTSESYRILDQVAEVANKYPQYNLEIAGHTDNVGSSTTNQRLSERRANSCYIYLLSRMIPNKRMTYAGYGETRPVANNDTPQGRALNRRTEFNIYVP